MELTEEKVREFDLRTLLNVVRKGLLLIIILGFGSFFGSLIYLRYTHAIYESQIELKFDVSNDASSHDFIAGDGQGLGGSDFSEEQALTQVEIIRSPAILSSVVNDLNLRVQYYQTGTFILTEIYRPTSPFVINYDSATFDLTGNTNRFNIIFRKNNQFELSLNSDPKFIVNGVIGKPLNFKGNRITVYKNPDSALPIQDAKYQFKINTVTEMVDFIDSHLTINQFRGISIYKLNFRDEINLRASDILNSLARNYIERDLLARQQSAQQTVLFIDTLIVNMAGQLKTADHNLDSFEKRNHTPVILNKGAGGESILSKYQEDLAKLDLAELNIKRLQQYTKDNLTYLDNRDIVFAPIVEEILSPQLVAILTRLNEELYNRKIELANSTFESPAIIASSQRILELKKLLDEGLKNSLISVKRNREFYNQKIAKADAVLSNFPSVERGLRSIQRSYEIADKMYSLLQEKRLQYSIIKAEIITKSQLINKATAGSEPISPKTGLLKWGSLFVGLLVGFLIVVIKELLRETIDERSEIESRTLTPIISEIVRSGFETHTHNFSIEVLTEPKSALTEAFRALRANLQFVGGGKKNKIIAITSTISGEGKSFIAINLAAILTLLKKRVVIVDLDLRRPRLHDAFNLNNDLGFSNVIVGQKKVNEVIRSTGYNNFDLITSGSIPPNPAELLASDEFSKVLKELSSQYDYIVLDTSPVGLVTDAIAILNQCDIGLYVFRAGVSRKGFIKHLDQLVEDHQLKHLFAILNCTNINSKGYGYGYGYGQGYYVTAGKKPSILKRIWRFFTW